MTTNLTESIKQRLLNYARAHQQDYNFVLRQYVLQRLMYRLGASEYAQDFLLKGGLLFWVWQQNFHRPTQDMDLLGFGSNDIDILKAQLLEISPSVNFQVVIDFAREAKIRHLVNQYQGQIVEIAYTHEVIINISMPAAQADHFMQQATNETAGDVQIDPLQ